MILRYVKDKDNLVDFNIWSGGSYLNDVSDIPVANGSLSLANVSSIGNHSFYIVRTTTGNCYALLTPSLTESDIGKTITITIDVYTPNNSMKIQLYDGNYVSTEMPMNTAFETGTVSRTIVSTSLKCYLNITSTTDGYFDNVNIFIQ